MRTGARILPGTARPTRGTLAASLLFGGALLLFLWQFVGIRYATHDDIFLQLQSLRPLDEYMEVATPTAEGQGRVAALVNLPMMMAALSLYGTPFYDIVNLGSFASLIIALLWLASLYVGTRIAASVMALVLLSFPLHYYFTFPQGFPLMFTVFPLLGVLSLILLVLYLRTGRRRFLLLSVPLFFASLWTWEHSPPLVAVAVLAVVLVERRRAVGRALLDMLPYAAAAAVFATTYLRYQHFHPPTGRLEPRFVPADIASTIAGITKYATVPGAALEGGQFGQPVQVNPTPAGYADWDSLVGVLDVSWLAAVVVLAAGLFLTFTWLSHQRPARAATAGMALGFLAIWAIPVSVLSLSGLYQESVAADAMRGHAVTAYAHVGLAGALALGTFAAVSYARRSLAVPAALVAAGAWAVLVGGTLAYNVAMRDYQDANRQRWEAFELLLQALDGREVFIEAPGLLAPNGVSATPGNPWGTGLSYWSELGLRRYGARIAVDGPGEDPLRLGARPRLAVAYFATPEGSPLLGVTPEGVGADGVSTTLSLVSRRPVALSLAYTTPPGIPVQRRVDGWQCAGVCRARIEDPEGIVFATLRGVPTAGAPPPFIAQLFSGRGSDFTARPE